MGFSIGSFYCLTQRNQNLHPFNFLRGVFARGGTEYMSIKFFFFRHLQSAYLDASVFGGWSGDMKGGGRERRGGWRSSLMLLLRVSGSEARSQNTHGEQAE